MEIIRVHFSKLGRSVYISHLDLQRVMARAVRISGFPAWYSQGINPHIYMTFALPLPLMCESVAETVDFKTEEDLSALGAFLAPLSAALPEGIEVSSIAPPVFDAGEIARVKYSFSAPAENAARLLAAVKYYNEASAIMALRKTKRSEEEINLKEHVPGIAVTDACKCEAVLPAGASFSVSPSLLAKRLAEHMEHGEGALAIRRECVYTTEGATFI